MTETKQHSILIVEDDEAIREMIKMYLERYNFKVFEASTGKLALANFKSKNPDLIILDLSIPEIDGIEVCKRIRETSNVPIIMVTARTSEIDEIKGLQIGANDYVKKPFSPRVLIARIKRHLKIDDLDSNDQITIGEITLDRRKREVYKNGKKLSLSSLQFDILNVLMSNPGTVFERYTLITKAYKNDYIINIYDRTIDSHIKNIRKILEDNPKKPKYILTVRGVGYKFAEESDVKNLKKD